MTPLPEPDSAGLRQGQIAQAQSESVPDVAFPEDVNDPEFLPAPLPSREETVPVADLSEARDTLESPEMDEDGLPIEKAVEKPAVKPETAAKPAKPADKPAKPADKPANRTNSRCAATEATEEHFRDIDRRVFMSG